jgi:hypothetical protein
MESEILSKLTSAKTVEEVETVIETYYPNWLVLSLNGYSNDYPHLQRNWEVLCQKMNTTPQKIILVDDIVFGEIPTTLNKICEFMTLHGYVVRRASEFIACSVCEKAIPCIEIWRLLVERRFPVPPRWSNICIQCGGGSAQSPMKSV